VWSQARQVANPPTFIATVIPQAGQETGGAAGSGRPAKVAWHSGQIGHIDRVPQVLAVSSCLGDRPQCMQLVSLIYPHRVILTVAVRQTEAPSRGISHAPALPRHLRSAPVLSRVR
jgi:hypothetical protein